MKAKDWASVSKIYKLGMDTGLATFETELATYEEWDRSHLSCCRLVAISDGKLVAWAALQPVSSRKVYAGVAEVSVYVHPDYWKGGIGTSILSNLVVCSEKNQIWTLQASIFPENEASYRVHAMNGFRLVGRREKIAMRDGIWRDTLILERRSKLLST